MSPDVIDNVLNQHEIRLIDEPNLNYLKQVRKRYDLNKNKKVVSLDIEERKIQKDLRKSWLLNIENQRRSAIGMSVFASYEEMEDFNDRDTDYNNNSIDLESDYQLIESTKIIDDFLKFSNKKLISVVE